MKTVIIKLGGAAITNKKGSCQLADEHTLDALMQQIQQAHEYLSAQGHRLILIHGAGSFGHPQARQYNLKQGWVTTSGLSTPPLTSADDDDPLDQKAGFAHTRKCLLELHLALLSRLQQRGLPVLGLSPFEHLETDGGDKSPNACFEKLANRTSQYLKLGFIPLLHGDAVLDRSLGCTILSGDIVMHKLVMLMPNITRCVFVTDVEGIYDADPKTTKRPKLIKHMPVRAEEENNNNNNNNNKRLPKRGSATKTAANRKQRRLAPVSTGVVDVTGGMGGKVKWARQIMLDAASTLKRTDLDIVICKAASPEATRVMSLEPVLEKGLPVPGQLMTVFSWAQ
ncbi:Aspartate/glutamate/uridylate kinase [Zychaea mexicana]|uniref:Aspartate/glutamate/uridylate kinase n=1 Tax=Zychaea mexicana TaxID=64656 RepID=UPI0022FE36CA|nr:Aspartate/glutamate/uridylate kinase [Zychaea mexicana]KAI9494971.1 Aspartate/glutamate/uridylate kinase [Zychaea mexicana]